LAAGSESIEYGIDDFTQVGRFWCAAVGKSEEWAKEFPLCVGQIGEIRSTSEGLIHKKSI
jgi:hypothetical protein